MQTASLNLTRAAIFGGMYNGEGVEGWHFLHKECDVTDFDTYKKLVLDAIFNTVIELDYNDKVRLVSYDDMSIHEGDESALFSCCAIPDEIIVEEFEKMIHRND